MTTMKTFTDERPWYAIEEYGGNPERWRVDEDYTFSDEESAREWYAGALEEKTFSGPIRLVKLTPEVLLWNR